MSKTDNPFLTEEYKKKSKERLEEKKTENTIKELQEMKLELKKNKRLERELDIDIYNIIAKEFILKTPCYYDKHKNIFLFNKKKNVWEIVDKTDIINVCKNVLDEQNLNQGNVRSSCINAIMDLARWHKPKEVPKHWIHFSNCFFDINTEERKKVDKNYFSQIKIPHKLGKTTETPIIDKIITDWVGKEQYELFIQICAYCMYKDYPFARFFIFYGTGQDGKSTAGKFISKLIGVDNSCSIDIDQLNQNRFEAQKLYQKTLAICGEVDYKLLKNTRKLKGVSGDDPITIEFKNKDPFQYNNFAKLIWYANGIPPTYDKTEGFYRRAVILKFPKKFKEKCNPLDIIPEYEYENFCLKCLISLKNLLLNGFSEKTIEEKKKEYEELSNPVLMFVRKHLREGGDNDFVTLSECYKEYCSFAKKNAYRNFSYNDFLSMMKNIDEIEIESRKVYKLEDGSIHLFFDEFNDKKYTRSNRKVLKHYYCVPSVPCVPSLSTRYVSVRESNRTPRDTRDTKDIQYLISTNLVKNSTNLLTTEEISDILQLGSEETEKILKHMSSTGLVLKQPNNKWMAL